MKPLNRSHRAFLAGLSLSLAVHLGVLVVLGRIPIADTSANDASLAQPERSFAVDFIPPAEDPVRLGITDSQAQSPNWIGFAEPTEHHAPQATTDQPALARDPGVGQPEAAAPSPPAAAEHTPSPPTDQTPLADAQIAQAQPQLDALLADLRPVVAQLMNAAAAFANGTPDPPPAESARAASSDPGEASDKDSDPTALAGTIDVVPGHPAAGKGLEIKTVRPRWLNLTRMTSRPNNPRLVIRFLKDGTVSEADFEPGEGTGYEAVDGPLLDAVYAWRASGEALGRLPATPGATLEVNIHVILR